MELDSSICSRLWTDLKKDSCVVGMEDGGWVDVGRVDSGGALFCCSSFELVVIFPVLSTVESCWEVSVTDADASGVDATIFGESLGLRASSGPFAGAAIPG